MNIWTQRSIELANQYDYLDQLFKIYPLSANEKRNLSVATVSKLKEVFDKRDSKALINLLLDQVIYDKHVFPIKYSYVSYLKYDRSAIDRNPKIVERIAGYLYDMEFSQIIEKAASPKESNRQMGALFKNYINNETLGLKVFKDELDFMNYEGDAIYNCSDTQGKIFAKTHLGYNRDKGLDFIARVNGTYIIAEAKFLTDFGGSQNSDLDDAFETLYTVLNPSSYDVRKIIILDGVAYIQTRTKNKMYKRITEQSDDTVILSAILLREFLGSI